MGQMSWIGWALLSLLFVGLGNFSAKLATLKGMDPIAVSIVIFCFDLVLATTLYSLYKPNLIPNLPALGFAILAGIGTGLGLMFVIKAFTQPGVNAGVTTALMNTNFALVALLSVVFLRDYLTLKQLAGLAAILGGIFLLI